MSQDSFFSKFQELVDKRKLRQVLIVPQEKGPDEIKFIYECMFYPNESYESSKTYSSIDKAITGEYDNFNREKSPLIKLGEVGVTKQDLEKLYDLAIKEPKNKQKHIRKVIMSKINKMGIT